MNASSTPSAVSLFEVGFCKKKTVGRGDTIEEFVFVYSVHRTKDGWATFAVSMDSEGGHVGTQFSQRSGPVLHSSGGVGWTCPEPTKAKAEARVPGYLTEYVIFADVSIALRGIRMCFLQVLLLIASDY